MCRDESLAACFGPMRRVQTECLLTAGCWSTRFRLAATPAAHPRPAKTGTVRLAMKKPELGQTRQTMVLGLCHIRGQAGPFAWLKGFKANEGERY